MTRSEFVAAVRDARDEEAERETLLGFIVRRHDRSLGQRTLLWLDYLATSLFAGIGTIIAGQAGMNIVGCSFVGGVASMGGGTLNNVLTGNTRGGVFWMKNSAFLAISMATSIATFYLWPKYEELIASRYVCEMQRVTGEAHGCSVDYEQFRQALNSDAQLAQRIYDTCKPHLEAEMGRTILHEEEGLRYLFEWLTKGEVKLGVPHLEAIARWECLDSPYLYAVESVALGAVSVIGAQGGIIRGARPLSCIATGVTICFGGILRDLLCQRPVAIGGQSYALATAAGATVYVMLRQLVVAGYAIPLVVRIGLAAGTTMSQRALSFWIGRRGVEDSFLAPMANYHNAGAAAPRIASSVAEKLCDAGARGDLPTLRQLAQQSVDMNRSDYDWRCALHLAASEGRFAAVKLLVTECGADVNPIDRWGGTPLDDAMRSKHALVASYLRTNGGRPGAELLREEAKRDAEAAELGKDNQNSTQKTASGRLFRTRWSNEPMNEPSRDAR